MAIRVAAECLLYNLKYDGFNNNKKMESVEIRMDLVARSQVAYFTRYCRNHIWIRKYSDDE
ncbi:hypothetical protein T4D_72 [Trichinella pseudospiralis]|uniref:Uncharacterized protein n=2 Tax=Trichinella pseudospiralis TaxID=6337 RepID=A0A0V1EJ46_TRIPS|nr:hypothetical protein T4D_72 [Trichinella pseudospiralis]